MIKSLINFFKTGPDKPLMSSDASVIKREFNKRRWSTFTSITLGYGLYYVCRLSLSVVKKPMMDANILTAKEFGMMGSALFITYGIGKFANGFISDYLNVKRFISIGLLVSALAHLALGFTTQFYWFVLLWGINGWFQSMGAAPCIVSLSQWFGNKERGTFYGIWYASHNIGAGLTYIGTAVAVVHWGWQWGFFAPGILCSLGAVAMYLNLADRPQTYGLPSVADFRNDHSAVQVKETHVGKLQLLVLKNPAVWILGLASALMYFTRYTVESWGMFYLETQKDYTTIQSGIFMTINQFCGIAGTISCGWVSDALFHHRRNFPALIYGIIYAVAISMLVLLPPGHYMVDAVAMGLFGFSLGALVCYLGGLMAVDLCPKRVAGATMGMIGLFSYAGSTLQEFVNGWLIQTTVNVVDGKSINTYHFGNAPYFWVGAAVLSLIVTALVWKAKEQE